MTANRTRKTAATRTRKTAEAPVKAPVPMDDSVVETAVPVVDGVADVSRHAPFSKRTCYSLDVLIAEVTALYHEVSYEITEVTSRLVGVGATFTGWDSEHSDAEPSLPALLALIEDDPRVAEVTTDDDMRWISVRFYPNPVTMDSREEFGLADAYHVIVAGDGDDSE